MVIRSRFFEETLCLHLQRSRASVRMFRIISSRTSKSFKLETFLSLEVTDTAYPVTQRHIPNERSRQTHYLREPQHSQAQICWWHSDRNVIGRATLLCVHMHIDVLNFTHTNSMEAEGPFQCSTNLAKQIQPKNFQTVSLICTLTASPRPSKCLFPLNLFRPHLIISPNSAN